MGLVGQFPLTNDQKEDDTVYVREKEPILQENFSNHEVHATPIPENN